MADRKALERAAAVDGNVNLSQSSGPPKPDPSAQGESLFLPYLVEHLRSSLQQQPVPPVRRRRHDGRTHTAQQHAPAPAHYPLESGRVEDSGTESGEDLRFIAAGLRDSIELHRQGSSREQDQSQGILGEVQSALSRLHSSLQQGCIGNEQVDPSKQDSLLHLIERLQTSLQLPTAGSSWSQKQMKLADLPPTAGTQAPQESSQRFAGRRSNRRARHTIGVTREELADVRRFLEEAEMRNKMSANAAAEDQDKPPEVPPLPSRVRSPYDLVKQSSAGDVPTATFSAGSAFRPYRPTHFLPKKYEESHFGSCHYTGVSDAGRNVSTDETSKKNEDLSHSQKPPDRTSKDRNDDETEDEDDEEENEDDDSDANFVEEKAVTGKAWIPDPTKVNADPVDSTNVARTAPNSAEYDPSSKLFTPSQSVQIAVHKAAINKQLSVEEEMRQTKTVVQSETSDEDTMTDATYESATEKAESDGYEEEDREDEEDDHEKDNVRNNAKNTSSGPAKIIRNLTYTIQPKESPAYIQRLSGKQTTTRVQEYQFPGQPDLRQDQNKQLQQNNNKNQRVQKQENRTIQQNNPRQMDPRAQAPNPKDYPSQNRNINPKQQQQMYQNSSQRFIETSSKYHHQSQFNDDHRNGKTNKPSRTEPTKGSGQKEAIKNFPVKEETKTHQQDRNNNFPSNQAPSNVGKQSSVEQKIVHITQAELPKTARFANRQLKKQKMKRANTIDIPKPLHHYGVEDDSEVSSDDDSQASQKKSIRATNETSKAIHTSTQQPTHNPGHHTAVNRQQTHVEHDRRASVPQKLEKKVKKIFEQGGDPDNPSYNPQSHGGAQWNNRFANIKTCFENPVAKDTNMKQPDSMSRARSFWRSADDSTLKVSKNSAFHDPKLTKQGSQFLKKLHEQKDQGQSLPKLPWTATEHENVVVGSLVVPANLTKTVQQATPQGPVNKFSHAPMSAFRPIEKKNSAPVQHTPWAAPSVTGSVKQIASSKFSQADAQPSPPVQPIKHEPPKNTVRAHVNLPTPSTAPTSVSPTTLPWTKDVSHGHNLNSTLAKFESMSSRESSPQLMPNALLRSHSQDRIPLHSNFAIFNKSIPAPPPRTYIPAVQTNLVQTRTQNLNAPFRHDQGLPFIHEQPHPHPLSHSKSNQYLPQSSMYSGPAKSHPLLEGDNQFSDSENDEPTSSSSRLVLSTLQGTTDQSPLPSQTSNGSHVQTYSAGVTARQSIYGVVRHPVMVRTSSLPEHRDAHPPPPVPSYLDTPIEPEMVVSPLHAASGDFAEEHTAAVTRVMGETQCQAAVTVSHKTRRCNEEDEGELGSAAFHLASLLHKFSGDNEGKTTNKPPKQNDKPMYESAKHPVGSNSPAREHDQWVPAMAERSHQEFRRLSGAQPADLPPKPEGSPRPARSDASFNRTVDSRSRSFAEPRQERFPREVPRTVDVPMPIDDSTVYATRFEIPVNKVQSITLKFQSSTLDPLTEPFEERKPPVSPNPGIVLRKSESWHQLAAQQQGLSRRPQSMVVADLPPVKPRSPNAIPKAKSSHSLAFPKQFEAAIKPEALEMKQKTVEEFLKKGKTEMKIGPSSSIQKHSKTRHRVQTSQSLSEKRSFSADSAGVLLLDDNLDNVDEAFESLFNATSTTEKTKHSSSASSRTVPNRR